MMRTAAAIICCLLFSAAVLNACATREFYLRGAEAPWEEYDITVVEIPAFKAPPDAWALAQQARARLVNQLVRGTVRVSMEESQSRLNGQVARAHSRVQYSAPRRVLRPAGATPQTLNQMADPYVWEVDAYQEVRLRLSLQLTDKTGRTLWLHDVEEAATDSRIVVLPWPGQDVMTPPLTAMPALDPLVQRQLDESALEKIVSAVEPVLTHGYGYRDIH